MGAKYSDFTISCRWRLRSYGGKPARVRRTVEKVARLLSPLSEPEAGADGSDEHRGRRQPDGDSMEAERHDWVCAFPFCCPSMDGARCSHERSALTIVPARYCRTTGAA
jgi:hypothetical protein